MPVYVQVRAQGQRAAGLHVALVEPAVMMPPAAVVVAEAPLYRLMLPTVALSVLVPPLKKKLPTLSPALMLKAMPLPT